MSSSTGHTQSWYMSSSTGHSVNIWSQAPDTLTVNIWAQALDTLSVDIGALAPGTLRVDIWAPASDKLSVSIHTNVQPACKISELYEIPGSLCSSFGCQMFFSSSIYFIHCLVHFHSLSVCKYSPTNGALLHGVRNVTVILMCLHVQDGWLMIVFVSRLKMHQYCHQDVRYLYMYDI